MTNDFVFFKQSMLMCPQARHVFILVSCVNVCRIIVKFVPGFFYTVNQL